MRTLYLCYFGVREPLVHTQVLPYLRQLSRGGIGVDLLTFEPGPPGSWSVAEREGCKDKLLADGVRWHSLPYHKRPSLPATLYDVAAGALWASRFVRREGVDVVHARAHVAALMGALVKRRTGKRLIFDIRGFNPEEYVDAGVWPDGGINFRLAKRAERFLLKTADGFVVLTEKARSILFPGSTDRDATGRPIEVIPCCADLSRFGPPDAADRQRSRDELGLGGRRVIVYVGSLGGFYLTDEMADFLATACRRDPSTFALILSKSAPSMVTDSLARLGVPQSSYLVRSVAPAEVPRYLGAADVAVSFIKPTFSKLASSPTKVAEYLASGLPVVCNAGIGDLDEVIAGDRVGVVVRALSREGYLRALDESESLSREDGLAARCLASARRRFDLERVGGARYRRLYARLGSPLEGAPDGARPLPWTS